MIQIIGLMIGCYILVRMFSFALREGEHKESTVVQVLSVINIIVTFILMILLLATGVTSPLK